MQLDNNRSETPFLVDFLARFFPAFTLRIVGIIESKIPIRAKNYEYTHHT
jgi:hypothetical protein